MNKIKFILFPIAFGIAGFLIGFGIKDGKIADLFQEIENNEQASASSCSLNNPFEQEKARASVMIDFGDDLLGFEDMTLKEGDTVYSILDGISKDNGKITIEIIDYGGIGAFVNSINGRKSGDNNKYWQYWVNNKYADVAADKYVLKNGDVIMWKFTSSRYEKL